MQFFGAAEGVAAPALEEEGDYWRYLCPLGQQRVALGSAQAGYCVLDARPSQGYPVLKAWRSPAGRLEALHHCGATGQFWALERGPARPRPQQEQQEPTSPKEADEEEEKVVGEGAGDEEGMVLELVRYASIEDGEGPAAGRASALLSSPSAMIGVGRDGSVAVSLEGGRVELWTYAPMSASLQRQRTLQLDAVLGISTEGLIFSHVALLTPHLLAVGLPTDVWLVQLGTTHRQQQQHHHHHHHRRQQQQQQQQQHQKRAAASSFLGELEADGPDMLDCAVVTGGGGQQGECIKAPEEGAASSFVDSAAALLLSHLSFHRPRYTVSEVKLLAPGGDGEGEGEVDVLVVAGRAAHIYRVGSGQRQRRRRRRGRGGKSDPAAIINPFTVVTPVAELGFSSLVLGTAMGGGGRCPAPEHPWLFVLTLSGVEVWALPPPPSTTTSSSTSPSTGDEPLSPCRLLLQRLEFRQQLDRLPPLGMAVAGDALVLLANPPGHTPASLPEMLFHTVPRPSPEQRIPELSGRCPLGEVAPGADGAFGLGYDLLALRIQPLASVYRHVHAEARRTLSFGGAPLSDGGPGGRRRRRTNTERTDSGGAGEGEDGQRGDEEEEEDDDEEEGRYLARFVERELLDASVYGIQPERVIHHSGTALLTTMHALLAHAAAAASAAAADLAEDGGSVSAGLEAARAEEARALYTALARKCASLLGSAWLEARAEGVDSKLSRACAWFLHSDTPVLDVCGRLLARWRDENKNVAASAPAVAGVLVEFLRWSLRSQQQKQQQQQHRDESRPLVVGVMEEDGPETEQEESAACPRSIRSSSIGPEGEGAAASSWDAVIRFAHAVGGPTLLGWLVMESALPWRRLPRSRATARRLLLGSEGEVASLPASTQALLLTLALHDLAAAVASQAATVTLDSAGGVAWLGVPGVGALLATAISLAEALGEDGNDGAGGAGDAAVTQACLRAAPAVVKHLVLQDVPLVVKGPFFPYLEAKRPRALARVLAAAVVRPEVSGSEFLFETPQVLRLLGPWGLGLAQEMGRFLAKNEKLLLAAADGAASNSASGGAAAAGGSMAPRAAASSPVPTLAAFRSPSMGDTEEGFANDSSPSKGLVHLFLAARFDLQHLEQREQQQRAAAWGGEGDAYCPDAFPWRELVVAELLGLDLDKVEKEEGVLDDSGFSQHGIEEEEEEKGAAAWLLQLAGALPCGTDNPVVRRLGHLLAVPSPGGIRDWEWVLRWLYPRLNGSSSTTTNVTQSLIRSAAAKTAARLLKTVCLAQAGGGGGRRMGEAVELLFGLLAEAEAEGAEEGVALDVLTGFGRALFGGDERTSSERWRLVLAKAPALSEQGTKRPSLYEGLMHRLSQALPLRALVQAIPDDADVDEVLALMEGGRVFVWERKHEQVM